MQRSLTTGDWLRHDMSPVDPYSRSKTMYEPSSGPPQRDARFKGFTSHGMSTEHRPGVREEREAPLTQSYRYRRFPDEPGQSHSPGEFFAGRHTTKLGRVDGRPIEQRFMPDDVKVANKGRAQEHQREIESFVRQHQETKQRKQQAQAAEKRKDYQQLTSYDPWGKPGAGAPGDSNRLINQATTYRQQEKQVTTSYAGKSFGKQGGGAPRRTGSGRVRAQYQGDPETQLTNFFSGSLGANASMRFARQTSEPTSRVQQANEYREHLERQKQEREHMSKSQRKQSAEQLRAHHATDPFGKPGAGAPARTESGRIATQRKAALTKSYQDPADLRRREAYASTLREQKNQEAQRRAMERSYQLEDTSDYNPWGKGVGVPAKDTEGKPTGRRANPGEGGVEVPEHSLPLGKNASGAGSMNSTRRRGFKEPANDRPINSADPFGKPGAGAPLKTQAGEVDTRTVGRVQKSLQEDSATQSATTRRRHDYLAEQKVHMELNRQKTKAHREEELRKERAHNSDHFFRFGQGISNPRRGGDGQLADQHRPAADIIGMSLDQGGGRGRKQKTGYTERFHRELDRQAKQKKELQQKQRKHEVDLEKRHLANTGAWTGTTGPGAPRRETDGMPHGRFERDSEVHYSSVSPMKHHPAELKKSYRSELDRQKTDAEKMRQSYSKQDREKTDMHMKEAHRSFGRQGNGAPLRTNSGAVISHPSKVRPKGDVEWKLNAKKSH